jgi:Arylsulfotransferase (ASST)
VRTGVSVLVLTGLLAGPAASAEARQPASSKGLHVIPFPATPDVARGSSVIFSSLDPSDIASVAVSGSSSGVHPGHLTTLPDDAGTAFVPALPFTAGEHVRVVALLASRRAGSASGAPGARRLQFSFTVARVAPSGRQSPSGHSAMAGASGRVTHEPCQRCFRFHSRPGFQPPLVGASGDPDPSSGDIFITARIHQGSGQQGPMILNPRGQLVWFDPLGAAGLHAPYALNLQVQRYHGQPVLTFWTRGRGVIMNRHYQTVATVRMGEGYFTDEHDFQITRRGTALLQGIEPVRADLASAGGPVNGVAWDSIVQEVDIRTGQILWEWHALGHVPIGASELPMTDNYPYFHLNSLQELPDGNIVMSARHTWGVYEVDKQTGKLVWTLGGKYSSFTIGAGAHFYWQHDARLTGNRLTVFDDGAYGTQTEQSQSSAKVLQLNFAKRTASLIHSYRHRPPLISGGQGSAQLLPNGNMFVGWGDQPDFSEYTAAGDQIFTGSLPAGMESYRARRFPWIGQPLTRPSLAISAQASQRLRMYASWNGATQVLSWRALGGPAPHQLSRLGSTRRTGFETEITLHTRPRYLAVQALDSRGRVLRTSRVRLDSAAAAG